MTSTPEDLSKTNRTMSTRSLNLAGGDSNNALDDDMKSQNGSVNSSSTSTGGYFNSRVARKEQEKLNVIKIVMILVLLAATVFVSLSVYYTTRQNEEQTFEAQFHDQAEKLIQEFSLMVSNSIGAVDNFAVTITSHVRSMNLAWPYAFVPEFDIRAASTSALAKAAFLTLTVAVPSDILRDYEEYSVEQSYWVDQALARQFGHPVPETPPGQGHGGMQGMHIRNLQMDMMMELEHGHGESSNNHTMPNGGGGENMMNNSSMTGDHNHGTGMPSEGGTEMGGGDHDGMMMNHTTDNMMNHTMGHEQHGDDDMDVGSHGNMMVNHGDMMNHTMDYPDIFPHVFHYMDLEYDEHEDHHNIMDGGHNKDHNTEGHQNMNDEDHVDHHEDNNNMMIDHGGAMEGKEIRVAVSNDTDTMPIFQCHPVAPDIVNYDLNSHPIFGSELRLSTSSESIILGKLITKTNKATPVEKFIYEKGNGDEKGPMSQIAYPVYEGFGDDRRLTGFLTTYVFWLDFIATNLPESVQNIIVVLANQCGQVVSYQVNSGEQPVYLGEGDFHDTTYAYLEESSTFNEMIRDDTEMGLLQSEIPLNNEYCPFEMRVYPSVEMHGTYTTNKPMNYTLLIIGTFLVTCLTIFGYDWVNEKRNKAVLENAKRTNQIISSLFPAVVRDRLFGNDISAVTQKHRLRKFLDEGDSNKQANDGSKPIADLFTDTTILFADIAGFTAWSSVREPSQVFTLLETLYGKFDSIASARRVFKVETIGDCYVAATGLPEPQVNHAPIMTLYAKACLYEFTQVTHELERTLGPDTSNLGLRIGLNSGPVTAGVLRGEKSRFQLFGDTVNTAARMESTSVPGRIHCSPSTADCIREAGLSDWLEARELPVDVKGKGATLTYWVTNMHDEETMMSEHTGSGDLNESRLARITSIRAPNGGGLWGDFNAQRDNTKNKRLIAWHVELLTDMLKQIVAQRTKKQRSSTYTPDSKSHQNPRDEVAEAIVMPEFDPKKAKKHADPDSIELHANVVSQLEDYVTTLACMYRGNPFHNFAHASHVTMAAKKLLSRIVAADEIKERQTRTLAKDMHGYSFGLTSDPLTQFAILFSAIIHDLDHNGVSNPQLVKEEAEVAVKYSGKSVAEQNSVDLAWELLMDPSLTELRNCIYTNEDEYKRFRQLTINCVIATDIFDKELKGFRNKRWDDAFHKGDTNKAEDGSFDKRATIVIEHIIQAADVSHCMQHWHVYQKWNERLFQEMYQAYHAGRGGDKDPAEGWFKGELWFFDNYIIPLAKKLEECNVFGVSSSECLDYAKQNRSEWEKKGEKIVKEMKKKYTSNNSGTVVPRPVPKIDLHASA